MPFHPSYVKMTACIASTTAAIPTAAGAAAAAADTAGAVTGTSVKHATMSATYARALSSVVACWTLSPQRTPRHCWIKNTATTEMATGTVNRTSAGNSAARYSPMRMAAAASDAVDEIQSLAPITKPAYGPNARRANTYCPPDRGITTPSSASDTTPSSAYAPPAIHASMKAAGLGNSEATVPGVRSIPEPMVLPMMTATPNAIPSTCRSLPRPRGRASLPSIGLAIVDMRWGSLGKGAQKCYAGARGSKRNQGRRNTPCLGAVLRPVVSGESAVTVYPPSRIDPDSGIPDLIRRLTEDSRRLASDEVRLAKLELHDSMRTGVRGVVWLSVGLAVGVVAAVALTV